MPRRALHLRVLQAHAAEKAAQVQFWLRRCGCMHAHAGHACTRGRWRECVFGAPTHKHTRTYTHTQTQTHTHTHTHTQPRARTHTRTRTRTHAHRYTLILSHTHACARTHTATRTDTHARTRTHAHAHARRARGGSPSASCASRALPLSRSPSSRRQRAAAGKPANLVAKVDDRRLIWSQNCACFRGYGVCSTPEKNIPYIFERKNILTKKGNRISMGCTSGHDSKADSPEVKSRLAQQPRRSPD